MCTSGGQFRRSCDLLVNDVLPLQPEIAIVQAQKATKRQDIGFFFTEDNVQAARGKLNALGQHLGLRLLSTVLATAGSLNVDQSQLSKTQVYYGGTDAHRRKQTQPERTRPKSVQARLRSQARGEAAERYSLISLSSCL